MEYNFVSVYSSTPHCIISVISEILIHQHTFLPEKKILWHSITMVTKGRRKYFTVW